MADVADGLSQVIDEPSMTECHRTGAEGARQSVPLGNNRYCCGFFVYCAHASVATLYLNARQCHGAYLQATCNVIQVR
jgi:hypothetical protein